MNLITAIYNCYKLRNSTHLVIYNETSPLIVVTSYKKPYIKLKKYILQSVCESSLNILAEHIPVLILMLNT